MKGKDLLTLAEFSPSDLDLILRLSKRFKEERAGLLQGDVLAGATLALIFQKHSTRTRVSFEVAMSELGGHSISLTGEELQLGRGETVEDTAAVLSRYVHVIMARVNDHAELARLARASTVPVINGLSDLYHPVQVLADLLTLQEKKGRLKGLRVAWTGDGNNVCNSWMYGAAISGIDFTAATPRSYRPPDEVVRRAGETASRNGGSVRVVEDPREAAKGADCVVTDAFVSMGFESERDERLRAFMPRYTVTRKTMSAAKRDALFMHCMPVHRGEEVEEDVVDGPQSVIIDEAENRLHTTKAVLAFLLLGRKGALPMLESR